MIELSTKGTFTTLEELLTGKVYIGTVPQYDLRDPFQDAVPCWQRGELMLRSPYTYMTPRKTKAK